MYVDSKAYNDRTYHELWKKIKDFIDLPIPKAIKVSMKLILLDDADTISATHQNSMKIIMDKNSLKLKWIFIAKEPRKFIQYFQTKAMILKCKNPNEKEALLIILSFCQKFKIGYDRLGIKCLFDSHSHMIGDKSGTNTSGSVSLSLSNMMNILQITFSKTSYISEENILKTLKVKQPPKIVGPYACIEPFKRCRVCTLYPPCKHNTFDTLVEKAEKQRSAYPEYLGEKRLNCPEFVRTGKCSTFNKHKRCMLAHPRGRTQVEKAVIRCTLCTIQWPCQKCYYSKERNFLLSMIDNINKRLNLLVEINVPEPPIHLVIHLMDEYEDWEMSISALAKFYLTNEKFKIKNDIIEWINDSYCTIADEYEWKSTHLKRTYGEILTSPLLTERKKAGTSRRNKSRGNGDDDDDMSSSRPGTKGGAGHFDNNIDDFNNVADDGSSVTGSIGSLKSGGGGSKK
jgi:hypothetical protein